MTRPVDRFRPTERFSRRAADYVRYRPRYPQVALDAIVTETGLTPQHAVADVGSGTGFSAELFLRYGCRVFGIEPNAEMRAAGDAYLAAYPLFTSVAGTAEATTLPDAAIDLIVAGQAFHWFDVTRARTEFARILRPGGWVALLWQTRDTDSPFMRAYEDVVERHSTEVRQVHHRNVTDAEFAAAFADGAYRSFTFPYVQEFDLDGLLGRTFSSSYMPGQGEPGAEAVTAELTDLFHRHAAGGRVAFAYTTELYLGPGPRQDTQNQ
jgi:SAM-dependent methyltransferase